ncbi:MAG: sodium:calcium antiporter, partial [Candidatus Cryptobacteroides sp.]
MLLQIILFLFGLMLVVWGADALVDGASSIARKFGISEFVIGLTIVGMGTSAPEMVVSFIGAIGGNADIAVGNVIGSNIFNTLLILGLTAMILPMNITYLNLKKDIPINIVITVLLLVLGMNFSIFGCGANRLSRVDGLVLLALFCLYMYMSFRFDTPNNNEEEPGETKKTGWAILLIVLGLNGLVVGGKVFVDSAVTIAKMLNVS